WCRVPTTLPETPLAARKRCLERAPKKRLRDIGEARIALDGPLEEPGAAAPVVPVSPPRSIAKTLIWASALVVTAMAGVAVVGILKGTPRAADTTSVVRFNIGAQDKMDNLTWPRISPGGTMIAFQARGESGKTSIWVRRLDTLQAQELPGTE